MRPEDFEDAALVSDQSHGLKFNAKIDVLESMGSEFYAYFVVESERVASRELEELADDAGGADLPQQEGNQIVARLDAASTVKPGPGLGAVVQRRASAAVRPRVRQDASG